MTISGAGPAVESAGALLHFDFLQKFIVRTPKYLYSEYSVELHPGLGGLPCQRPCPELWLLLNSLQFIALLLQLCPALFWCLFRLLLSFSLILLRGNQLSSRNLLPLCQRPEVNLFLSFLKVYFFPFFVLLFGLMVRLHQMISTQFTWIVSWLVGGEVHYRSLSTVVSDLSEAIRSKPPLIQILAWRSS